MPRPAAEIQVADGYSVLSAQTRVETEDGHDLSHAFITGADAALALTRKYDIQLALLKSNSPSCGNEYIYNGHFNGELHRGSGVTAARLARHGIQVFNEFQISKLVQALKELETALNMNAINPAQHI